MSLDIKNNVEKLLFFFISKCGWSCDLPPKTPFWYTWGADGLTVGRTVKWLPKFLECIDYQTFLGMGLRSNTHRAPGFVCQAEEVLFSTIVNNFKKGDLSKTKLNLIALLWWGCETQVKRENFHLRLSHSQKCNLFHHKILHKLWFQLLLGLAIVIMMCKDEGYKVNGST